MTQATPTIRPYQLDDVSQLLAIEQAVQFSPWTQTMFEQPLSLDRYQGRVLCQGSQILGFYLVEQILDEATLHNIAVSPEVQGQGFGRQLLTDAMTLLQQQGAAQLLLEVRESNSAAQSLYLSQGFVQVGIRKEYYAACWGRENGLVMVKSFESK